MLDVACVTAPIDSDVLPLTLTLSRKGRGDQTLTPALSRGTGRGSESRDNPLVNGG